MAVIELGASKLVGQLRSLILSPQHDGSENAQFGKWLNSGFENAFFWFEQKLRTFAGSESGLLESENVFCVFVGKNV